MLIRCTVTHRMIYERTSITIMYGHASYRHDHTFGQNEHSNFDFSLIQFEFSSKVKRKDNNALRV